MQEQKTQSLTYSLIECAPKFGLEDHIPAVQAELARTQAAEIDDAIAMSLNSVCLLLPVHSCLPSAFGGLLSCPLHCLHCLLARIAASLAASPFIRSFVAGPIASTLARLLFLIVRTLAVTTLIFSSSRLFTNVTHSLP